MKIKIIFSIFSSLILIGTIITVSVSYPFNNEPDSSRFHSEIIRDVHDDNYLPYLLELENISYNSTYFDVIKTGDYHLYIENITLLIEREKEFLINYNSKDYSASGSKSHTFIYNGLLSQPISFSEFYPLIPQSPNFLFYLNYTTLEYISMTSFNPSTSDQNLWDIKSIVQYTFCFFLAYIYVNQTIDISEVYAPLAGTGTQFQRLIICDPVTGNPLLFISTEGEWWVS